MRLTVRALADDARRWWDALYGGEAGLRRRVTQVPTSLRSWRPHGVGGSMLDPGGPPPGSK